MKNIAIQYRNVGDICDYERNARTHSREQIEQLKDSLTKYGFVNPALVDEKGILIAGHGRLQAAKELGLKEVPVVVLSHLTDEQKKALRLADNRIQLNSSWDMDLLAAELASLKKSDFDLSGMGFSDDELSRLLPDDVADFIVPESLGRPTATAADHLIDDRQTIAARPIDKEPDETEEDEQPKLRQSMASDDEYSMFELVMLHENKLKLLGVLNSVRTKYYYDKLEDALMHVIRGYL